MRFAYGDAFKASRYTGYEVMIYSCTHGDATLFSRGDLVEAAWRVAQPLMDRWAATPADFPNYSRGSWGPAAASDLIERDGRRWFEVLSDEILHKVAIFKDGDPLFLSQVIMALRPQVADPGETIVRKGDVGREMYVIVRGEVEALDEAGKVIGTLGDGAAFGELALLMNRPRNATVRAKTVCNLMALDRSAFTRILHDHPQFAESVLKTAKQHHDLDVSLETLLARS
jgi:glucose-6-phosphate 1-dehydrogenase